MLESDRFYDAVAGDFRNWAARRSRYIDAVDELVVQHSPSQPRMIDVGSGDGVRAQRLADRAGASALTLMDSSREMWARCGAIADARAIRADIAGSESPLDETFTLVTCLWNVLGHLPDAPSRRAAVANLARLLAPAGVLVLDVHNRFNVRAYRWRAVRNIVLGGGKSRGDFALAPAGSGRASTVVHLFAPGELEKLLPGAGLELLRRYVIDYETGICRHHWSAGQLSYVIGHKAQV